MRNAMVWLLVVGCDGGTTKIFDESKAQRAKIQVDKYAMEAYPMWMVKTPDASCPPTIDTLSSFVNEAVAMDPWGTHLRMACGDKAPPGVKGMGVVSAGPDKKFDTADDIKSWER
jgi:hypothetical protein